MPQVITRVQDIQDCSMSSVSVGDLVYRGASAWQNLPGNGSATRKFLRQVSVGIPTWDTLQTGDIPDLSGVYDPLGTAAALLSSNNTWTGTGNWTNAAAANTSYDAICLKATSPASSGNQRYSAAVNWGGYGWATNSGGSSQAVQFRAEVQPVQGTANPSGNWVLSSQVNGTGGYVPILTVYSDGGSTSHGGVLINTDNNSLSGVTLGTGLTVVTPASAGHLGVVFCGGNGNACGVSFSGFDNNQCDFTRTAGTYQQDRYYNFANTSGQRNLIWTFSGTGLDLSAWNDAAGATTIANIFTTNTVNGYVGFGTAPVAGVNFSIIPAVRNAVSTPYFQCQTPADTALTLSTEVPGMVFGSSGPGGGYATVTRTWATGSLAQQRSYLFVPETIAFVGASTCTYAATVGIADAPPAGTNATLTSRYALAATTSGGTPYVTIGPSALTGASVTSNWLNITGTLPSTVTATTRAINFDITTAGNTSNAVIEAMAFTLEAGYTGNGAMIGFFAVNHVAGTGANYSGGGTGNFGAYCYADGNTTGANVGGYFEADNGATSVALLGTAPTTKNSGKNVGMMGLAINAGSSPTQVGGCFALQSSAPTLASCALLCDNGSTSSPVALFRVAGTAKLTVDSSGNLTQASGTVLTLGNSATTSLTPGVLAASTNASIVITDQSGQQYRIPCII